MRPLGAIQKTILPEKKHELLNDKVNNNRICLFNHYILYLDKKRAFKGICKCSKRDDREIS